MTRRLTAAEAADAINSAQVLPSDRPRRSAPTSPLSGMAPDGSRATERIEGPTVVLFLSTTCDGCAELAGLVRSGIDGYATVGMLRAPDAGLPDDAVTAFVGAGGRWLVGDAAFDAFDVRSGPFFCVIDARGETVLEGIAFGSEQVAGHCAAVANGTSTPDAVRLTTDPR